MKWRCAPLRSFDPEHSKTTAPLAWRAILAHARLLANEVSLETPFKLIPNVYEWPEGAKELFTESASYSYEGKI